MSCQPVTAARARQLGWSPNDPETPPPGDQEIVYVCSPPDKTPWHGPIAFRVPPMFQPPQPRAPVLPPAIHPMAQLMKSFFLQAGKFSMELHLSLAASGLNEVGKSKYHTEVSLGDAGKIKQVYAKRDPRYEPVMLDANNALSFKVDMVQLRDDGTLIARVRLGFHPLTAEVKEAVFKRLGVTPADLAKVGAAPGQFPEYPWQLLDLFLMKYQAAAGGTGPLSTLGLDPKKVKLDLQDSRIDMKVAIASQEIKFTDGPLAGFYFQGHELAPEKKYRVEVSGPLIPSHPMERGPVITLWGGKAIGFDSPKGAVEMSIAPSDHPIQFEVELSPPDDPQSLPPGLWMLPYKNGGATIRTIPKDPSFPELKLEMTEGVIADDERAPWLDPQGQPYPRLRRAIGFRLYESGPKVVWHTLTAHQMVFTGLGTDMKTLAPSQVTLSDGRFEFRNGHPYLQTYISGEAQGSVMYRLAKQPTDERQQLLGSLRFKILKGHARLSSRQEAGGDYVTSLEGDMAAEIPEMGLRVHNQKLGSLRVVMKEARMWGVGRLDVNITQGTVRWQHLPGSGLDHNRKDPPLRVEAAGGSVDFIQDPTKVSPVLGKKLGKGSVERIVSRGFFEASKIAFSTDVLALGGVRQVNGVPMLEITEGRFSEIENRGDFWGRIFLHTAGQVYPAEIKEKNKMKDAVMKIGLLHDRTEAGERVVEVSYIQLSGEESSDSLTGLDARLCGFRRQHMEVFLDQFFFGDEGPIHLKLTDPKENPLSDGARPHTHLLLKDLTGGCLMIGDRPSKNNH